MTFPDLFTPSSKVWFRWFVWFQRLFGTTDTQIRFQLCIRLSLQAVVFTACLSCANVSSKQIILIRIKLLDFVEVGCNGFTPYRLSHHYEADTLVFKLRYLN